MTTTFGSVARHGRGWLPMIGVTALLSSGTALALPAVLGRSVDAIVAGDDYGSWLLIASTLVAVGIACSIVDAFAVIVIAHRISSALRARRILVLDGNKAAVGNHTTLLRSSPLYRELLGHWQPGGDQIQPAS
ncbi:hypothetical protein ACFPJ1_03990 [Kribbella qitaiheensis]|uniref:hypothetical protein n=1 Tax=Kribbella qitaiheensis TaxID=1544730 RepID=UPI003623FA98